MVLACITQAQIYFIVSSISYSAEHILCTERERRGRGLFFSSKQWVLDVIVLWYMLIVLFSVSKRQNRSGEQRTDEAPKGNWSRRRDYNSWFVRSSCPLIEEEPAIHSLVRLLKTVYHVTTVLTSRLLFFKDYTVVENTL